MTDTQIFRGTRVFVEGAFRAADVLVRGERIERVEAHGAGGDHHVHDVGALALLPGLVDTHVHVNEPGRTEWEGFETATRAAAAGGITTLVDMPLNCIPVTTSLDALEIKIAATAGLLAVDVGFWGGVVPGNAAQLGPMAARGMLGAKCFLCHSGIDDFPRSQRADLLAAMPALRDAGVPLLVHAELELPGTPECGEGDARAYQSYLDSRPRAWEDRAIEMMVELCRQTRCAVHIVHLSSSSALPAIRAAKDEGLPFTVETCPHYLCLTSEEIPPGATEYKCSPPIRERDNAEALWAAVEDGTIDMVTSDHSPCTPHLKLPEAGDFCGAWGGIASLSLGLPGLATRAGQRAFSLETLVKRMTRTPAKLAGLETRKGAIAPGFDADLCVFDPESEWTVQASDLRFRHRVSPWIGRALKGRVEETWLRGRRVFARGQEDEAPSGQALLGRGGRA